MVRPNRSPVRWWLACAISSKNGAATGDSRAARSSRERLPRPRPSARRTSAVFLPANTAHVRRVLARDAIRDGAKVVLAPHGLEAHRRYASCPCARKAVSGDEARAICAVDILIERLRMQGYRVAGF